VWKVFARLAGDWWHLPIALVGAEITLEGRLAFQKGSLQPDKELRTPMRVHRCQADSMSDILNDNAALTLEMLKGKIDCPLVIKLSPRIHQSQQS
jgi:hypothetical protein